MIPSQSFGLFVTLKDPSLTGIRCFDNKWKISKKRIKIYFWLGLFLYDIFIQVILTYKNFK